MVPKRSCLIRTWKSYNSKMKVNSRPLETKGGVESDHPKGIHSARSKDLEDGGSQQKTLKNPQERVIRHT